MECASEFCIGNRTALHSPPPLRGRIQVGGEVALVPPILTFPLQGEGIKENFPLAGGKGCTGESDCKTLTGTLLYGL